MNFPVLCYNLVHSNLDCLSSLQNTTLIHYVGDIVLIEPSEPEVAIILNLLVKYMHVRWCEIKPIAIYCLSVSAKFLGIQWWGACFQEKFLSRGKVNCICSTPSHHLERSRVLSGPIGILRPTFLKRACYSVPYTKWLKMLQLLSESQNGIRLFKSSSGEACSANWTIWSSRPNGTWSCSCR